MTTNREVLAAAFPLHFQRICEAAYEYYGDKLPLNEFLDDPTRCEDAFFTLQGGFVWENTTEGHDYWQALAYGAA